MGDFHAQVDGQDIQVTDRLTRCIFFFRIAPGRLRLSDGLCMVRRTDAIGRVGGRLLDEARDIAVQEARAAGLLS